MSLLNRNISNGIVYWETFNSDQELHQNKIVLLQNKDFIYGTIRIKKPCGIILLDNVEFNPDNGDETNPEFDPNLSLRRNDYNT